MALTWAGEDFSTLLIKKDKGDPKILEQWKETDEALSLIEAGEPPTKLFANPTVVKGHRRSGIKCESTYHFLTVKEYRRAFKFDPKLMGEQLVSVWDQENLRKIQGILVKPFPGDGFEEYRKVTLWSETTWEIDETIVPEHRSSL
jgi:hypothetical protein